MKFRIKIMVCMLCLVSIIFGVGSSALIHISFQNGLEQEKNTAENSYRLLMYTLQTSGEMGIFSGAEDIRDTLRQPGREEITGILSPLSKVMKFCIVRERLQNIWRRQRERERKTPVWSHFFGQMAAADISEFQAAFWLEIIRCI